MKVKEIQEKENVKLQLKNNKKQKLKEKGITLIALVVTIIILLILVGVTLTFALGENGIIGVAKKARKDQVIAETKEAIGLEITEAYTEAVIRKEGLEEQQVNDIVSKYGELQEDGDTIITKKDGYEISLKEIYSGVLSESGSYGAKVEQIEMLEKELEDLKEEYKTLEEMNSGNTEKMNKLQDQIKNLTNEKTELEKELEEERTRLEDELNKEQTKNSTLQTEKAELEEKVKELEKKDSAGYLKEYVMNIRVTAHADGHWKGGDSACEEFTVPFYGTIKSVSKNTFWGDPTLNAVYLRIHTGYVNTTSDYLSDSYRIGQEVKPGQILFVGVKRLKPDGTWGSGTVTITFSDVYFPNKPE